MSASEIVLHRHFHSVVASYHPFAEYLVDSLSTLVDSLSNFSITFSSVGSLFVWFTMEILSTG